jgi:anaerobic magnesium-protoporphyrin IX monomethyl ester cyclase
MKQKKLLLVNPPLSLKERYGKMAESGTTTPPLGLCSLAAVTRNAGYETKIIDAEALGLSFDETVAEIQREAPDYVGITAVTVSILNAASLAKMLKPALSAPILLGGPHLTAVPEETMTRCADFDIGVIGEGEKTILELLDALDGKASLENIRGLILREGEGLKLTGPREFIQNLDDLPIPAWDLLPLLTKYYRTPTFNLGRTPATSLVTSRGCVGKCIFCDRKVFGNHIRGYSASYVLKMIRYLQENHGIKEIIIHDDAFVILKKRLVEFCNAIIDEKMDITWTCNARVDLVNPEMLSLMRKAGCWQIGYGIESGSQRILDFIGKGTRLETIEQSVRWTKKAGIRTRGFFMMGHPTETEESIRETINFAKRIPVDDFQITMFSPLPGSEAFHIAPEYGLFDPDWKKMNMWHPSFIPRDLTEEKMIAYHKKAFIEFYVRPRIIFSYLMMLRKPEHFVKLFKGVASLLKM